MKKCFLLLGLLLGFGISLSAQNNPYEIDDECYAFFQQAELLAGKDGFTQANESLLRSALTKADTKAQTLYYVERLKDVIRRIPGRGITTDEQDNDVFRAQEDVKTVADQLGYQQYYYYSYELVQNYLYNHGKALRALEFLQEMQSTAESREDPYGIWVSQRYLVSLYVAQGDYINAKPHILRAIKIYEESKDPIVMRQSVSRLFCDLSDTYVIGADSVKINVQKAVDNAVTSTDSVLCYYHQAKIAAYEKDAVAYKAARDKCLQDPRLGRIIATAPLVLNTLDAIMEGRFDEKKINDLNVARVREIKYIANVAENYGYKDQGFEIERLLVRKFENQIASVNRSKITEMDARMGKAALQGELADKQEQVTKISRLALILLSLILAVIIGFLAFHIRTLRKHYRSLMEANEKVRLADAAKTRFVQNMSHEVRTPLNAIVGFSQLLSLPDGSLSPEEKDEFASHIINNTKMLTMLLDDILNASDMDKGNYSINYEEGEKDFMAQAAISSSEHRLQPGVQLRYVPEDPQPFTFTTDPRRVQQILINLITNACKHTSEGEIVVGSSLSEKPGYLAYSVTDTGPGIPPEQAEVIFERFTKLNEFVQGTGLGLSICRDIASRMGAEVYLDTTYTGGSRFVFLVPVNPTKN